jgi:hypothetical protein
VHRLAVLFALAPILFSTAQAAEVQFEGSYRARANIYDSLSLDRSLNNSDGRAFSIHHRLWLRPRLVLSDHVAMFAEVRGLNHVAFGNQANTYYDVDLEDDVPLAFLDDLSSPTSSTDENAPLLDISLWRAWGEVHSKIGRFKFGRMPINWGVGIWQNDGLSVYGDYGDTVDRFQWELLIKDRVFVRAAVDINTEGFINQFDDTTSYNLAGAYRSELVAVGANTQWRRTPSLNLNVFTADIQADAEMGALEIHVEGVGQFGSGDLDNGFNEVNIMSFGAVLQVGLNIDPWAFKIEGGLATGDGNTSDTKLRTFTFDRDYRMGLMLFEMPMPTLAAAAANETNLGRSYEAALSGPAVSNALYLKPSVSRGIVEGLDIQLMGILARVAKVPESMAERRRYGMEFDLNVSYKPFEHVELLGTFGVFLPGTFYRNYEDDTFEGFSDTAVAGQLQTRIHF